MTDYSVHDEPDFARTYDEDEMVSIRKGDLRAVLDLATGSMDFGSGFWDNEQTEIARKIADVLGIDPMLVTPRGFACQYRGSHDWNYYTGRLQDNEYLQVKKGDGAAWYCRDCRTKDPDRPPPEVASG